MTSLRFTAVALLTILPGCADLAVLGEQKPPEVVIEHATEMELVQHGLFNATYDFGPYAITEVQDSLSNQESTDGPLITDARSHYHKNLRFTLQGNGQTVEVQASFDSLRKAEDEDLLQNTASLLNNSNKPVDAVNDQTSGDRCEARLDSQGRTMHLQLFRRTKNSNESSGTLNNPDGKEWLTLLPFTADPLGQEAMFSTAFYQGSQAVGVVSFQMTHPTLLLDSRLPTDQQSRLAAAAFLMRELANFQDQIAASEDRINQAPDSGIPAGTGKKKH